jgi:transcriptional regulator with XRE-family HTH domain
MLTAMNNTYRGADVNTEAYFGEWLQEELEKRGWTQAELARRAKLTRGGISSLISGRNHPTAQTCVALARALDLPAETVLKAADLLPELPAPENDPTLGQLVDLMRRMTPEEREEVLAYALYRFTRRKKGD